MPLASFSSPIRHCSQFQTLPPQCSLPAFCFLVGDPSIPLLLFTSMPITTRLYPNSETLHKPHSVLLTIWWSLSNFKLIIYFSDQSLLPQPLTLQGSVDLAFPTTPHPPVSNSCFIVLAFNLRIQALSWDLGKRESEKVKLLPVEQKNIMLFTRKSHYTAEWPLWGTVGNLVVITVFQKQTS